MTPKEVERERLAAKLKPDIRSAVKVYLDMFQEMGTPTATAADQIADYCAHLAALALVEPEKLR